MQDSKNLKDLEIHEADSLTATELNQKSIIIIQPGKPPMFGN